MTKYLFCFAYLTPIVSMVAVIFCLKRKNIENPFKKKIYAINMYLWMVAVVGLWAVALAPFVNLSYGNRDCIMTLTFSFLFYLEYLKSDTLNEEENEEEKDFLNRLKKNMFFVMALSMAEAIVLWLGVSVKIVLMIVIPLVVIEETMIFVMKKSIKNYIR